MKILYSILFLALVNTGVYGQKVSSNFFSKKLDIAFDNIEIPTNNAAYFNMDVNSFNKNIKSAQGRQSSTIILPLPDGTFEEFEVLPSTVMSEKLAAKFPNIKTYEGKSAKSTVRFDMSQNGFHAMLFTSKGTVYIDPINRNTVDSYQTYYKRDFLPKHKGTRQEGRPIDYNPELTRQINELVAKGVQRPSGTELRTYKLAISATGEYTAFHGGTVEGALSAIVTTMNRVNGIYEREVSIRMVLVDNTDQLIFTNASTDGFSNDDPDKLIDEVQAKIDAVIGDANYDIGHGVSTGGGGLAGLGVPCQTGRKASGITGSSIPVGDPYDVDYVAHEIGHQFGGNHTFNGSTGSCSDNRTASTAYEPGSGTTIMAYAGICSGQNIQSNSDAYFHTQSFDQIIAYTTLSEGNSCAIVTSTGNSAPIVDAGDSGFTIPKSTPFKLTGSATDLDGDNLTYSWEQFDLGPTGAPQQPTENAPLFRSFAPVDEPSRTFPQISDIVNNTSTMGEILPGYARDMTFRLTVRDNATGGGGVDHDQMSFNVTDQAGPFKVSSPNANETIIALTTDSVTWEVANTNIAPVNCQKVNILLSIDGGLTFTHTLISNTDNDGEALVLIPDVTSTQARIKVEAADNIFFDISNTNFSIVSPTEDDFSVFINNLDPEICEPDDLVLSVQVSELGKFTTPVTLSATGVPVGYGVAFSANPVVPGNEVSLTLSNTTSETGTFDIEIKGVAEGKTHTQNISLTVLDGVPDQVTLQSPIDAKINELLTPVLSWDEIVSVDLYNIQLSTDINFINIIHEKDVVNENSYSILNKLDGNTQYFWRVKAINFCGVGGDSDVRSFSTLNPICYSVDYSGNAIPISGSGTPTISSVIEIADSGTINDVNVKNLKGLHSYVEDLIVTIISPKGTEVKLFSSICGSSDNFDLNFDDDAKESDISCPLTIQGTFKPSQLLSAFNGELSQGIWTLKIQDTFDNDGGQLDAWTLEVCTNGFSENVPTELVATVNSSSEIGLVWIDNALSETGYKIYRSVGDESNFIEIVNLGVDTQNYSDIDLDSNTKYLYKVAAFNASGDSDYAQVEATTFNSPPIAPTELTAENSVTEISLQWKDNSDNEEEFIIERSVGTNSNYIEIGTVSSDVFVFDDLDAESKTNYFYRVLSRNNGGDSDYSNEVSSGLITGLVDDLLNQAISIYPNPSSGVFNLKVEGSVFSMIKIEVVNVLGITIFKYAMEGTDQKGQQLDLSNQPNGIYVVKVRTDQASSIYRIMKN